MWKTKFCFKSPVELEKEDIVSTRRGIGLALRGRSGRLITLLAPGDFLAKRNQLMKLTYFPDFWQVNGRITRKGKVSVGQCFGQKLNFVAYISANSGVLHYFQYQIFSEHFLHIRPLNVIGCELAKVYRSFDKRWAE